MCCRTCLEALPVDKRKCPTCRVAFKLSSCPLNAFVVRQIASLQVRCPHHDEGCQTVLAPGPNHRDLEKHLAECPHATLECNLCSCSMQRRHKDRHAQSCGRAGELQMQLAERDARLAEAAAHAATQQSELTTLRSQMGERDSLISTLQAQLKATRGKVNKLRSVLDTVTAAVADVEQTCSKER